MSSTQSPFPGALTPRATDRSDSCSWERWLCLQTDAQVVFLCGIYVAVVTDGSQLALCCMGPAANGPIDLVLASCSENWPFLRQLAWLLSHSLGFLLPSAVCVSVLSGSLRQQDFIVLFCGGILKCVCT